MSAAPTPASTAGREIVLSRLVNAPRELMNVKPGGTWRFLLTGPDGTKFPNRSTYREVVRPERLAYRHDSDVDEDPAAFEVTVTAEELGQQTLAKLDAFVQRPSAR
ncbi:SRPBCC domain-containing protein [Stigmatella erecta]|uniref:Uncharacterized conserved protein YndB, AHSA1/START domain n=1 Tax=Stigmatella erecta TaxID=83460 RepID=A0A1I0K5L2_9BACT|nr:SRPBCC domain-containing protein [Stigmatella erecta]SEU18126.1 Uncharacterized conserved protein YndB, AHSA1/START domain [Stigmatella erecta]